MAIGNIQSLWDIRGLEHIRKVCSSHGVHFTAFGGLIRRTVFKLIETAESGDQWDLFDIVPFASDIDLIHTAPADQTALLQQALVQAIPFGECFRWQLRSVEENGDHWDSMKVNNVIPASLMTLSTNSTNGIHDRWNGFQDCAGKRFRYIRNGFYSESPLFRAGRDLELFSALLYYRVLFEAGLRSYELEMQPGLADAQAVVADSCSSRDMLTRLEQSDYLRARLRYLCAALAVSAGLPQLEESLPILRLNQLLEYLDGYIGLQRVLFPGETLAIAAHLGGDAFRVPFWTTNWVEGADAVARFDEVLTAMPWRAAEQPAQTAKLGPGQEIVLASSPFDIELGISQSSHAGSGWMQEFLHFSVPLSSNGFSLIQPFMPDGVTTLAAFQTEATGVMVLSMPSVVELKDGRLLIRVNCGGLLEAPMNTKLQFFVVVWRGLRR